MRNIIRNILPAVAVMVAGLTGAYLVYDNYLSGKAGSSVAQFEPAAGEETMTMAAAEGEGTVADSMAVLEGAEGTAAGDVVITDETGAVTLESAGNMVEGVVEGAAPAADAAAPAEAEAAADAAVEGAADAAAPAAEKTEEHAH